MNRRRFLAFPLAAYAARGADKGLKIAVNKTTIESTPLFVAATMPGVAIELVPVNNGRIAMAQLVSGAVDAATGSETQLLLNSTAQPGLRAIVTLAECQYRIIARRSAGIRRIADLKGKKIAATVGTSSLYFLIRTLGTAKLAEPDVTVVGLEGPAMPTALEAREVDAVAIWEPHAENARQALGDDAVALQNRSAYVERFNLNTTADVLKNPAKRGELVSLIRNLAEASRRIHDRPADARRLASPILSITESTMVNVWPQFRFPASLHASVRTVMEEVEPWAAASQKRTARAPETLAGLVDFSLSSEARK